MSRRALKRFSFTTDLAIMMIALFVLLSLMARAVAQTPSLGPLRDADSQEDTVAENSPAGALIGITAQADNATAYTLIDDAGGLFAINPQSGTVTVAMDMLDYEAFSSHDITVQASDGLGGETVSFVIQVTDQPEPIGPVIDIDFTPNKIIYGSMPGTPVGIIARAADPDRGDAVTYSLSEDESGLFAINPQSGVVTLDSGNYDPDQDYLIEVTARSNDNTSSSAQFTVRRDEPLRIALASTTVTLKEGESRDIALSFIKIDLELIAISAGIFHTCGITSDNRAICRGANVFNQTMPIPDKKFIAISAGSNHTCGITSDNRAVCWGDNGSNKATPPSDKEFVAISAGAEHSCGITAANEAVCWGFDDGRSTPTSGIKLVAISSGSDHSCGITPDNDAVCWGGIASRKETMPTPDRKFIAIDAGKDYSCAITLSNDAVCWGDDSAGRATPTTGRKYIAISAGDGHSCAITTNNKAVCWGGNDLMQAMPIPDRKFIAVSAGDLHTCGITSSNDAVCWGLFSRSIPARIIPIAADSVTITVMVSDADQGQVSVGSDGQAVIPSGSTQITLTVSAADDDIAEPEADYTISLNASGHAVLAQGQLTVTVLSQAATVTVTRDELILREGETTTLVLLKALGLSEAATVRLTPDGAIDVTPTRLVLDSRQTERSVEIEALNNGIVSLIKPALIRLDIAGERARLSSTQVRVAIEDNDEYRTGFTMGRVMVEEGASVTATLSVAPPPIDSDWLMVELINSDREQISLSSTRVMLSPERPSVAVTVTADDDEEREGGEIYRIDARIVESNIRSGPPR